MSDVGGELRHGHVFLGADHARNERRTWIVITICGAMMLAEIVGGTVFHSMALIADGLHMSTHAGALFIAAMAYTLARRYAEDPRFSFGTGKLGDLAAFTSAIVLAMIAILIGWQSVERLFRPAAIDFDKAIPIAVLGLCVNLLTAWLLRDDHGHGHGHDHADHRHDDHHHHADEPHAHGHGHVDLNLRAAYVHVAADAAVSVLAIIGLSLGRQFGWVFMDPVMGIVGALVIANWSFGLVRAAGAVLLDMRPDKRLAEEIGRRLAAGGEEVCDLHLWRVGPGHHAAVISLASSTPETPSAYKARLKGLAGLSHVTIEVLPRRAATASG